MGLISYFLERRRVKKAVSEANSISKMTCNYINGVGVIAESVLRAKVTEVDLNNRTLLNYIGYISGIIYCACEHLNLNRNSSTTAPEMVLQSVIEIQLSWAKGIKEFSYIGNSALAHGGSLIDALQEDPIFVEAMKFGWEDFSNRSKVGAFPNGLFELQLISIPTPSSV